jgi:hypothetical protein
MMGQVEITGRVNPSGRNNPSRRNRSSNTVSDDLDGFGRPPWRELLRCCVHGVA